MQFFKKHGILIFFVVLAIHMACIYVGWDVFRLLTKLFLLPILILHYFIHTKQIGTQVSRWVLTGLFFSFMGDLLLTQSGEVFFLVGMLAFMGTHICNSAYFLNIQTISIQKGRPIWVGTVILLIIILSILKILNPYLGNFQQPIIGYMIIIGSMTVLAGNTIGSTNYQKVAIGCFIPGAALFVLSDGVLALNKFLYHEKLLDILVMLTYGLAQYFLVSGFIQTSKKIY